MVKPSIVQLRKQQGISRAELSNKTDIEYMTLYQFEKGNSVPNIIDALVIAKYFNKKVKDINWNF